MCTQGTTEARRASGSPWKKKKKKNKNGVTEVVKLFEIGDGNWTTSSVRAVRTLKCWAISPVPNHRPFKVFFPCYTTELICITSYSLVIHKRYATALFLMQANISHTCLLFPVHRSQTSRSNTVSELNSSPDFWHLTPSKRSLSIVSIGRVGSFPMTSHFRGMNRFFSDNSSFWHTAARREGPISGNQQPSTHSFNHRPRGPEKIILLNRGFKCSNIMQNALLSPREVSRKTET